MGTGKPRWLFSSFGLFVLVGIIGACWVFLDIRRDVTENIRIAQASHPVESDDVASLIAYVNSSEHTLKEKNGAVWTLGRIGDGRAVAALKPHYTGVKCYHVEELCQKELEKAIARCRE